MGELTREIWIDAPPERVYRYLVEPELTVRARRRLCLARRRGA